MAIEQVIPALAREGFEVLADRVRAVAGGSINHAYRVETRRGLLMLKVNALERLDMFRAEADGLAALADARAVAVPKVLGLGSAGPHAWLALEWLPLARVSPEAERRLGAGLARQHRCSAPRFGWQRDNSIGTTHQPNAWNADWLQFLRDARLGYQLELAAAAGLPRGTVANGRRLLDGLESFFDDYRPQPALLHGDLWAGNRGACADGTPYLFDPAVYFGDREADLAMTRLFGGFGAAFHQAYEAQWPLAPGADARRDLYNLYHLLNHFNLFGGAYLAQVTATLTRLLKTARQGSSR